jgi:hypothetical protein
MRTKIDKYRFKINLFAIVLGTNMAIFFLDVSLDAAIFSMLTIGTLAYIINNKTI